MSLKNRLGRLSAPVEAAVSCPEEEGQELDVLRQRLGDAFSAPKQTSPLPQDRLPLGFGSHSTRSDGLLQRIRVVTAGERVGRVALEGAALAQAEQLGLLALDPTLAGVDPARALYFDTETTGLGGAGTVAFLLGFGYFDDSGRFVVEQVFLDTPAREEVVLGRVQELFEQAELLVSFNGKSFDLPLLRSRMVMNRLPALPQRPHLDLLHVARRLHRHRLSRCTLKTLESAVLGWERSSEDVAGADIAPLYGQYLRSRDGTVLNPVVEHNEWDVLSMAALVSLYGESLLALCPEDFVGAAETLGRAGERDAALLLANEAVSATGSDDALRVRARLRKARRERIEALSDFEALAARCDDSHVHFELTKLYEHHARDFEKALAAAKRGTGEGEMDLQRRLARIEKKLTASRVCGPMGEKLGSGGG